MSFREALRFWFALGFVSFGGLAGQIAIMHTELVERRRWISEKRFLHALNYCMVQPGPVGHLRLLSRPRLAGSDRPLGAAEDETKAAAGLGYVPRVVAVLVFIDLLPHQPTTRRAH